MSNDIPKNSQNIIKTAAVAAAVTFLYATVLAKLGVDWWSDENYSHGLLVPFVIGLIVWKEWDTLTSSVRNPSLWLGSAAIVSALLLLIAGTLGAELFTRRISLVLMLAGIVIYFFGLRVLNILAVPFALLLLAIPIPQIVFNRIAFPLQIWASQMAVWGIRLFEVPTLRKGNVIEILPHGATQTISLEVVEACSGIRSLMTLVTLALIMAYFTRQDERGRYFNLSAADLTRAILLMVAAVPIAVFTNAARVTGTGVLTFYYGKQATESTWHDMSGWTVYVVALALLIGMNYLLRSVLRPRSLDMASLDPPSVSCSKNVKIWPVVGAIIMGGIAVNWFATRSESTPQRKPLSELHTSLGDWRQKGSDFTFDPSVESVLKTTDYTMREYSLPDGRVANLYVGYYASQRSGATYHSPQNCLPGAGWVMKEPQYIDITRADGTTFQANRYLLVNGQFNEVMIYWYQGRGRIEASEYNDKINTVFDSITRRRSDGAIVRVMTGVGGDEPAAVRAAADLSAQLAETLSQHAPK
jgi:exosortase D (VPLPA-CTERM-specific)